MPVKSIMTVVAALLLGAGWMPGQAGAAFEPGVYNRNGYMLQGRLAERGYDWWWHSLVAEDTETCELQPFFIQYYVINPALGGDEPVLGQLPANRQQGLRPSYAMIRAGTWSDNGSTQIRNFYGISDFSAETETMDVTIGDNNTATETRLRGSVRLTPAEAAAYPEYRCDAGSMSWDLVVEKEASFSLGYATSELFARLGALEMFWHAQGMLTRYSGTITYNGQDYTVRPEISFGYQDKNWGSGYANPWIWLSCNNFTDSQTGKPLRHTSLIVGGNRPVLFGLPLGQKLIVAFYHEGELYEFNFLKFWTGVSQESDCGERDDEIYWKIAVWGTETALSVDFSSPKAEMQLLEYESPLGGEGFTELWSGGSATGTVTLYKKMDRCFVPVDVLQGSLANGGYGSN